MSLRIDGENAADLKHAFHNCPGISSIEQIFGDRIPMFSEEPAPERMNRLHFPERGATCRLGWRTLQPGVELATIDFEPRAPSSDNKLIAVRIDPDLSPLTLALATEKDKRARSAAEWCRVAGLAVAINVGMFQDDGLSNVGHLVDGDHVNSNRWASKYHSVLAFGPRDPKLPSAIMVDCTARVSIEGTRRRRCRMLRPEGVRAR